MAHTFDAKNRVTGTANPLLVPHTCGSGATVLVLSLVVKANAARTGGAPSYNGVAMTQVGTTQIATETNCELWYRLNPSIGTFNVSIPNAGALTLYAITSSYKAQAGYTSIISDWNAGTGVSANPSLVVLVENGGVGVDVLGDGYNSKPTGNSAVLLYSTDDGLYSDNAQYTLTSANSVGWTVASDDWCMIVVAFRELAGGAVETITAKNFPMLYVSKPVKTQELISKVEGATITKVANDFPEELIKSGKAKELKSKWA